MLCGLGHKTEWVRGVERFNLQVSLAVVMQIFQASFQMFLSSSTWAELLLLQITVSLEQRHALLHCLW